MAMYVHSVTDIVKGIKNRRNPVTLFIIVCKDINCFLETYPNTILLVLIAAIALPQIHNHPGIWIAGNNLNKDTATKMKSAMVSS